MEEWMECINLKFNQIMLNMLVVYTINQVLIWLHLVDRHGIYVWIHKIINLHHMLDNTQIHTIITTQQMLLFQIQWVNKQISPPKESPSFKWNNQKRNVSSLISLSIERYLMVKLNYHFYFNLNCFCFFSDHSLKQISCGNKRI